MAFMSACQHTRQYCSK